MFFVVYMPRLLRKLLVLLLWQQMGSTKKNRLKKLLMIEAFEQDIDDSRL